MIRSLALTVSLCPSIAAPALAQTHRQNTPKGARMTRRGTVHSIPACMSPCTLR